MASEGSCAVLTQSAGSCGGCEAGDPSLVKDFAQPGLLLVCEETGLSLGHQALCLVLLECFLVDTHQTVHRSSKTPLKLRDAWGHLDLGSLPVGLLPAFDLLCMSMEETPGCEVAPLPAAFPCPLASA